VTASEEIFGARGMALGTQRIRLVEADSFAFQPDEKITFIVVVAGQAPERVVSVFQLESVMFFFELTDFGIGLLRDAVMAVTARVKLAFFHYIAARFGRECRM
jgi:hypothetical protein